MVSSKQWQQIHKHTYAVQSFNSHFKARPLSYLIVKCLGSFHTPNTCLMDGTDVFM